MQNYTFNSKLPLDTSSHNNNNNSSFAHTSFPPLSAQLNPQQLQLHLELQQQLSKAKKLNENDYEYYDDEEYDDEGEGDEDDEHNQSLSRSNNSLNIASLKRPKGELVCVVCGASANGYNFDAITCESCKAFFRRNAFRPLNLFRCSNNNQCDINIQTRKKCKKCRIVKCFNLGMRRDWIMTEMEREEKRRKIEENRKKKTNDVGCSSQDSMLQSEQSMQATIVKPIRRRRRRRRHSLLDQKPGESCRQLIDEKKKSFEPNSPMTSYPKQIQSPYTNTATSNYTESTQPLHTLPTNNYYQSYSTTTSSQLNPYYYENDDSQHKRNRADKDSESKMKRLQTYYSTLSPQSIQSGSQPPSNSSSPSLLEQDKNTNTKLESSTVEAIRRAYRQAIQLVKAHGQPNNSDNINDTINLTELGVRRIIFYFKLISDFRNLDHDLMVKLLKQNMMNIIQLHGINSYNKADNSFKEPDTDDTPFSAESLQSVYGEDVYKKIINITVNLYDLCHGDMVYIKLLMLVILFDPQNDLLTSDEKVFIKSLQDKYLNLMYASLCEKLGCTNKAGLVLKGMLFEANKISDLARWFERTVQEKSDSEYVRPLMKEVLSLPQDNTPPSSIVSSSTPSSVLSATPSSLSYTHSMSVKTDIKNELHEDNF